MRYQVHVLPSAGKVIERLPRDVRNRVAGVIDGLAENPRPAGCKKLAGQDDLWRARAGDWRIIYSIEDRKLIVLVVKVGHRKDVYRSK
ncbi:MAG: type II toxin-antitoxin system RelE/ParE family toxin [Phycisphaeraceae bacterium]|nr:type II toxin-antitoxin system RelE/ParE family toxin [Phycisphaeraceae bacterium]